MTGTGLLKNRHTLIGKFVQHSNAAVSNSDRINIVLDKYKKLHLLSPYDKESFKVASSKQLIFGLYICMAFMPCIGNFQTNCHEFFCEQIKLITIK